MSVVRFFAPENRLGAAIAQAGGKLVETAIADADEQILMAADETKLMIDACLDQVFSLAAKGANTRLAQLYQAVREVAGLAGLVDLSDLGAAAHTFCNQIELAMQKGALSEEQIQVNLGSLRLLRQPERFSEPERKALLDNLQAVLDKALKTAAA
ncbi:MAG TPA: hypothetical protein VG960_08275 [Caulobacteraceae bacterium]|nr:hypothetical protein [Caulobacteraceae bacterium]